MRLEKPAWCATSDMAPFAATVAHPLYLDHPASTRPDESVIEAMLPWLRDGHANPHADNRHGQRAAAAIEQARAEIANLIGADPGEIVFTSGATEANNLALRGMWPRGDLRGRLAISPIEHKSLLETANDLAAGGLTVCALPADAQGRIDPESVRALGVDATRPLLVSCAHANNELGVVQDLAELMAAVQDAGGRFHVDAAQTFGKVPLDVGALGLDLASLSSHKIYGPAGIGALFVAADLRTSLRPLLTGGGQEGGVRSGTVPVFLAVGFGCAAALASRRIATDAQHLDAVVNAFVAQLSESGVVCRVLSPMQGGLPGLVSLHLPGVEAADLLDRLGSQLSASTGSACSAGELRASHVLRSIGMDEQAARQVVRIGFGRDNTQAQAREAAQWLAYGITLAQQAA